MQVNEALGKSFLNTGLMFNKCPSVIGDMTVEETTRAWEGNTGLSVFCPNLL